VFSAPTSRVPKQFVGWDEVKRNPSRVGQVTVCDSGRIACRERAARRSAVWALQGNATESVPYSPSRALLESCKPIRQTTGPCSLTRIARWSRGAGPEGLRAAC
jgi:hypothetical protein